MASWNNIANTVLLCIVFICSMVCHSERSEESLVVFKWLPEKTIQHKPNNAKVSDTTAMLRIIEVDYKNN